MRPELLPTVTSELTAVVGEGVVGSTDASGTIVLDVPASSWVLAATHLRDVLGLDFLDWLSAVDATDRDPAGVDIVLHVADSGSGGGGGLRRVILRTRVADPDPQVASLTGVWPGVAWHERETFEMFGVGFDGFDDGTGLGLRPLLLPDGFEGTPLRKSFVLVARAVKAWPGAKEPGESDAHAAPARRKTLPPGVPDPAAWGPRGIDDPVPDPAAAAARPARPARPARAPKAASAVAAESAAGSQESAAGSQESAGGEDA